MTTAMRLPSDDELRLALLREPPQGLAAVLADEIARDVRRSPQRRSRLPIAPWRSVPDAGLSPQSRRIVWLAVAAALVLVLLATILLIGALLRKPTLLGNGVIALAPPDGGIVLLDAGQQTTNRIGTDRGSYLAFSSSGDRLAFWSGTPTNAHGEFAWTLAIMDVRTQAISTPFTDGVPDAVGPNGPLQWSSDGQRILAPVLADGSPGVLIADLATGRFERVGTPDLDVSVAAWSPNGKRLAYIATRRFADDWHVWLADPAGADSTKLDLAFPAGVRLSGDEALGGATGVGYPVAWSPDSTELLVTAGSEQGSTTDFVVRVSDASIRALTRSTVDPVLSRWSPDGSRIAFLSFDKARAADDLYVIDSDGSKLERLATDGCGFVDWAPDASRILFDTGSCEQGQTVSVMSVKADGTDPQEIWSEPRPTNLAGDNGGNSPIRTSSSPNGGDSTSMSWQGIAP